MYVALKMQGSANVSTWKYSTATVSSNSHLERGLSGD